MTSELHTVFDDFECAWVRNETPDLSQFLPDAGSPLRREALLELIRLDLEFRWRNSTQSAGEMPRSLLDYAREFPELTIEEMLVSGLVAEEYRVRRRWGDSPHPVEFADRFEVEPDRIIPLLHAVDAELADEATISPMETATKETVDVSFNSADETYVPSDPMEAKTIVTGLETEPAQPSASESGGKRFGDYELLHEIARGGMGVVYKARQTKLNRIVALKMIKAGELAGQEEVQRFHAEAEAAAQLDHPGIVPIYEVGEQDGQHFFSMGYVDGSGLDAKLKDGPLPPREAAELIKTIAEAVQYAHEKGIVHRDLKPANVLLQSVDSRETRVEREDQSKSTLNIQPSTLNPKITDFGLAKNISGDSGMTATGQVLGTPSYMPPEQAAGKIEEIGPSADVYSLGAMLYATLTGRPPFQAANVMETLKQVSEQEPVSPTTLNPAVDKDLETICLKCLEKESLKRYASAGAFACDIDRYLDGKPIVARPLGKPARLWRWCRRNPLGATVVGLLTFLSIAGPAIAVYQIEINRQLDDALEGETEQREKAQANEKAARESERKMGIALDGEKAALGRKDRALLETEAAIDRYVKTVKNAELLKDPRFKSLQKELLTHALAHYQRFVKEHQHEQGAKSSLRTVWALFEIGNINSEIGTVPEAIKALRQAVPLWERLVQERPSMIGFQSYLARTHNNLGLLYQTIGEWDRSFEAYRQAGSIFQRLAREQPGDAELQSDIARNATHIAALYQTTGKPAEALKSYLQAVEIQARLIREHPSISGYQSSQARTFVNLANLYTDLARFTEAFAAFKDAQKILGNLARTNPQVAGYRHGLATSHKNVGKLYHMTGKSANALASIQQALRIWEVLVREHPTVTQYRESLASGKNVLGVALGKCGRTAEALAAYKDALKIQHRIVHENPKVTDYQKELASSHINVAGLYHRAGKSAEALAAFQRAVDILKPLAQAHPNVAEYQNSLASAMNGLGVVYESMHKTAEALATHQQAIKIRERLVNDHPAAIEYQTELAGSYGNIGLVYKSLGKPTEALAARKKALELYRRLARRWPEVTGYQKSLGTCLLNLGVLYDEAGDSAQATSANLQAAKIYEQLVREFPKVANYQMALSRVYNNTGSHLSATGRVAQSLTFHQKAIDIGERLAREHPRVASYRSDLARSLINIGLLKTSTGDATRALQAFRRARTICNRLVHDHPEVPEYRATLAHSHFDIGAQYHQIRKPFEALAAYRQALTIRQQLAREYPAVTEYQVSLARSQHNIGLVQQQIVRHAESLNSFEEAIAVWTRLRKLSSRTDSFQSDLQRSHYGRALSYDAIGRYRDAAADWRIALKLDSGRSRAYFAQSLCVSLARAGDHVEAVREANRLLATIRQPSAVYNVACIFALASAAAAGDPQLAPSARTNRTDEIAKQAMALLKTAESAGFFTKPATHNLIRSDPDLNPLRHRDDFRQLAHRVRVPLPAWAIRPRSARTVAAAAPRSKQIRQTKN